MTYDDTARPAPPVDISSWPERERLAAVLIRDRSGVDDDTIAFYRSRYGRAPKDYFGEALATADVILAAGFAQAPAPDAEDALDAVLDVIADSITDAAYGLEVEDDTNGLVISWPLDNDHPQPPGLPSRIRVTLTDLDA